MKSKIQYKKVELNAKRRLSFFQYKTPLFQAVTNSLMIPFKHSKGKQKTKQI